MAHEHPYFIKDPENRVNHPTGFAMWNGWGSVAHHSGPMFRYILHKAAAHPQKNIVISSCSDDIYPLPEEVLACADKEGAVVIAPVLCSYGSVLRPEYLYIPASDEYFMYSLYEIFAPHRIPWEERIPKAVWRGGLSGEMLRIHTVQKCLHLPHADVKLVDNWPRPEYNPDKTPELFAPRIEPPEQCTYKAVFWIDGNCISSNVLWVFATGAVPILINETYYWFKDMIQPWVHYVPVRPDLSDLEANLQWIFDHDAEARRIAENALEFCRTRLSPEAQRAYLDESMEKRLQNGLQLSLPLPPLVERLMPLVSFGAISNSQWVRRRGARMVECALRYMDPTTRCQEDMDAFDRMCSELLAKEHPRITEIVRGVMDLAKSIFSA